MQYGTIAKLGTTKRRYKDSIFEDIIRLSIAAKGAWLSGRLYFQHLRPNAAWSAKKDHRVYWQEIANKMGATASGYHSGNHFRLM